MDDAGCYADDEDKRVSRPVARRKSNLYEQERPSSGRNNPGINKDVVARISQNYAVDNDDTEAEDEGDMYGYGGYGYNTNANMNNKHTRRASTSSFCNRQRRMSTSSRTSRPSRRRSTCSHMKRDPLQGLYPNGNPNDSDSSNDLNGYESEFSISGQSTSSKNSRTRRNSCLASFDTHAEHRLDNMMVQTKNSSKNVAKYDDGGGGDDSALLFEQQPAVQQREPSIEAPANITPLTGNSLANVDSVPQNFNESWKRKDPLTTSHVAPTLDNLPSANPSTGGAPPKKKMANDGWGDLHFAEDAELPSSEDTTSEQSYGETLYTKSAVYQELDQYKQKARRRDSLVNTCVIMSPETDTRFHFKPADGISNASDFIVRCFAARLRISGFTVLKHNKSRWSKPKHRIIYLMPDGKTLTFKDAEGESKKVDEDDPMTVVKSKRKKHQSRPKIDLSTVLEVRHAWTPDPHSKNKRGTAILRNRCKDSGLAGKSFSLIFAKRSLDLTAFSNDQCKIMLEGFSALCYRLKELKYEERKSKLETSSSRELDEDDWACSTVHGGGSGSIAPSMATPSLTNTNTTNSALKATAVAAASPWGV